MNLLETIFTIFLYAKQPTPTNTPIPTAVEVHQEDRRVGRLRDFFASYNSPLVGSESHFIEAADKYSLDWTLLPAIAGVESTFEKAGNTEDHNPFGYMCKSGPCRFDSFDEAIDTVARTLGEGRAYARYRDSGSLSVLAEIYNYVSPDEWASKIRYFQEKLK